MNAHLVGIGTAVPEYVLDQSQARQIVESLFGSNLPNIDRLLGVFDHAHIGRRHFMKPPEWYAVPRGWAESNAAYLEAALSLAVEASIKALTDAGLTADDIDAVVVASTTGIATPSLDALLMLALNAPSHAVRVPMFGLGCAGGVSGLARAAEICDARNSPCTLFVAVEICSATFQRNDTSKSNLVGTSLFADGAAAVVLSAIQGNVTQQMRHSISVKGSYSTLFRNTEDIMGWDVKDTGLGVRFSRDIPAFVIEHIAVVVNDACAKWGITLSEIDHYVLHPGGAKVIEAHIQALHLQANALRLTTDVLHDYGNMSSPTVLFVLDRMLNEIPVNRNRQYALMSSLGPGFSAEQILLELS